MSVSNYDELKKHIGHKIVIVGYGTAEEMTEEDFENVSIECETCNEVLLDFDK